jgi:hypothetical protein
MSRPASDIWACNAGDSRAQFNGDGTPAPRGGAHGLRITEPPNP